jgi:hypothetical protein
MAMGDSTNTGRRIRHIPDDRSGQVSGARRADDARRRSTGDTGSPVVDHSGETVTDIVDLLDAMFTDDEGRDDRLMISVFAADEITRLRAELVKTTQDLEDAKTLLSDSLPRLVDAIRLRAENAKLREIIGRPL